MIIMMKQFNGLLFGEGVFLVDSLTVIVSRRLFRKSIVLEGGIVLEVRDCFAGRAAALPGSPR